MVLSVPRYSLQFKNTSLLILDNINIKRQNQKLQKSAQYSKMQQSWLQLLIPTWNVSDG